MNLLTILLPSLIPALADGIRGLIARITGGAGSQPQNIGEAIQLMNAQTERLKALAELDKPTGEISKWVADLRAAFRYVAVGAIELAAITAVFAGIEGPGLAVLLDLAGAAMAFIIGERMYLHVRPR